MRGPPHTREPIKMKNFGLRPFLFFAASAGAADTATAAAAAAKAALKYLQGAGI